MGEDHAQLLALRSNGAIEDTFGVTGAGAWGPGDAQVRTIAGFHPTRLGRTFLDGARSQLLQFEGFRSGEWPSLPQEGAPCTSCDAAAASLVSQAQGASWVWSHHLPTGAVRARALTGADVPRDVLAATLHGSRRWAVVVDRALDGKNRPTVRLFIVDLLTAKATPLHVRGDLNPKPMTVAMDVALHWAGGDRFLLVTANANRTRLFLFEVSPSTMFNQLGYLETSGGPDGVEPVAQWASPSPRGISLVVGQGKGLIAQGVGWEELNQASGDWDDMFN